MITKSKIAEFVSTGFWIGFSPFFPGTFGSIIALPISYLISRLNNINSVLFLFLLTLIGIITSDATIKHKQQKDPGKIIIDEIIGMIFSTLTLPYKTTNIISAFILFRIIDILKPPPIKFLEKTFQNGFGIILDDIIAGIFVNLFIRFLIHINSNNYIFNIFFVAI